MEDYGSADALLEDVKEMYGGDWEAAHEYLEQTHAEMEEVWNARMDDSFSLPRYVLDNGRKDNVVTAAGLTQLGAILDEVDGGHEMYANSVQTLTDNAVTAEDGFAALALAAVPPLLYVGANGVKKRVERYNQIPGFEDVELYREAMEQAEAKKLEGTPVRQMD